MRIAGWTFKVLSTPVDESQMAGERPMEYCMRVAENKAHRAASNVSSGVVVAADTIVIDPLSHGTAILGKPRDQAEAEAMLRRLRSRTHQVYTALVVLDVNDDEMYADYCITNVPMRNYTDEEMRAYIESGDPFDKAGGYAIQHADFHPVKNLTGCFANVMGLPLCHLSRTLARLEIYPPTDLPAACRSSLKVDCRIYDRILANED